MTRKALLFVNTHSRQGEKNRAEAISQLQSLDFELLEVHFNQPERLPDFIRTHQHQVDLVIIGGGDGTLNLAVDALVETQLPLGILPMGTANDLARTLNIPPVISQACQIIGQGQTRRIDLGWVNGKHFFNVASLGLSVSITRSLNPILKRRWGVLAYALTATRVVLQSRPFRAQIRSQSQSYSVKTVQIAIGNGRYYGGGMAIASDAAIDDHRLDLYSLQVKHWWEIIPLLPALREGRYTNSPHILNLDGTEIEVFTRRPRPINTDGEITTSTPAQFRVIPQALSVFVPSAKNPGNPNQDSN